MSSRVRISVEAEARPPTDVLLELEGDAPADEVLLALGRATGLPADHVAMGTVPRTGARLSGSGPIPAGALLDGDRLVLQTGPAEQPARNGAAPGAVELVVTSGPATGTRVALGPGVHVVGRGPGVDVVLADPSMSRRHLSLRVTHDAVHVTDLGSSNGTYIETEPVTAERALGERDAVEAGRSLLHVERPGPGAAVRALPAADGRIDFNRPPRVARPPAPDLPPVPPVPAEGEPARLPLGAALVPLALGGVLAAVTGNLLLLSFALLTPAITLGTYVEGRRSGGRRQAAAVEAFRREVQRLGGVLEAARREELRARREASPDAALLHRRAAELDPRLWERRQDGHDFLELRVGIGDRPPAARLEVPAGGLDGLRAEAEAALDPDARLPAVPVTLPLARGVVGLSGPPDAVTGLARWLVVQAATLHSPAELDIVAVLSRDDPEWRWLRWLPHVPALRPAIGARAGRALLEDVAAAGRPVLVVVEGALRLDPGLLARAAASGGGVVVLGEDPRALPGTCTHVVECDADIARLDLVDVRDGTRIGDVTGEGMAADVAEEIARLLAPLRDAGAGDAAATIPARVSLLDVLDLPQPTGGALARRWTTSSPDLGAVVGMAADAPFRIEVGRSEGLRLLLAGMPGAGKSELLQTLIAALAVAHPPDRLAFLLVDYKGGAAFRDAVELPHAVGLITDLDEHLAERARASLVAELRRREALLDRLGARNLRELTARRPEAAPPALLIVVDEFATLAREVPTFVDTVVDVAQRGRSLGLHLVLATQRPRGAVSDVVRANTNLRIAMRVADRGESEDVIEAGDAAAIPADLPGRAIALTGRAPDGSPALTRFQSAYAGGRTTAVAAAAVRVTPLRDGWAPSVADRVVSQVGTQLPTDLQAVVQAAVAAAEQEGIEPPDPPWLPPLPAVLDTDDLEPAGDGVSIGVVDEPWRQRRRPLAIDLERDGSLLVYGTSGSGKTVVLQGVARALALATPVAGLALYGLDFASGALRAVEALPHCGSVVRGDDRERVLRLLGTFRRALRERRQAGDVTGLPRLVLLLDGYGTFAAAYERVDFGEPVQLIARLAAEGRPLGIHVVVTADRRAEVPGSLSGVVPLRLVLRLADPEEFVALGVPRTVVAGAQLAPGRGFTQDGTEFQVALPGDLAALGRRLAEADPDRTPPVRTLPQHVPRAALPAPPRPLAAALGIADETLEPVGLDLADGPLLVVGPHRTGRTTALATLAGELRRGAPDLQLHLLAPRRGALPELGIWSSAAVGPDACATAAAALAASDHEPLVVMVDDAVELADGPAAASLDALLRRGRDADVRLVAAADLAGVQRLFGGWLRDLRTEGRALLLSPSGDADGDVVGVRLPRGLPPRMPPGRGFLVERGEARLVQVAGE